MPVINLDTKKLENLSTLSKVEIENNIPMIGAEIEKYSSNSVKIEFFPNRPDLYSIEGVVRALKSFCGINNSNNKKYNNSIIKYTNKYIINIDNNVNNIVPYIIGVIIKNIKFTNDFINSINDLITNLHWSLGRNKKKIFINMYDLDKLSFPLTYNIINGNHLSSIDSNNELISIIGINKKEKLMISENTKNIFLEVTGISYEVYSALNILTCVFIDNNCDIESILIKRNECEIYSPNLKPIITNINKKDIFKILGVNISDENIIKSLNKMGHQVKINNENNSIYVETPPYRSDIFHKRDIIEDIAIGYGYNNLLSNNSLFYSIGEETEFNLYKKKIFNILNGLGFTQVMSFSLTNENKQYEKMNRENLSCYESIITNPINKEQTILRTSLLPCILEILTLNKNNELPQNIFEIGECILLSKKQYHLCLASIGPNKNFTDILKINDSIFHEMNLNYILKESEDPSFISGRRANIYIINKNKEVNVGVFGEIDPNVINNFNLSYPIIGLEINLSKLFEI